MENNRIMRFLAVILLIACVIVAVTLIGGVGAWYFKIYRPKKQAAQPEEEYEEPDYSAYADEDDAWDEEDNV